MAIRRMAWCLILVMVVGAGCGSRPKSDVPGLADRFFRLLADGNTAEAYGMLAAESREETSYESFEWLTENIGFTGNRGVAWEAPEIDGDDGRIEGVVTLRDGSPLRQEVVCFKKGRIWEIHIVREPPDRAEEERLAEVRERQPPPAESQALAQAVMTRLAEALQAGDFTVFHRETAPDMRDHLAPERLQESFSWLAAPELELDWTGVRDASPVLDADPFVDEAGLLTMGGHVSAGGRPIGFQMQFQYVMPDWMLYSISIRPPL